jgi:hypothetical protein
MKKGKRESKPTPNFLTCPGVPELEPAGGSDVRKEKESVVRKEKKSALPASATAPSAPPRRRSGEMRAVPSSGQDVQLQPVKISDKGKRTSKKKRRLWLWAAAAIVIIVAAATGPAVFALSRAAASSMAAKSAVERMIGAMRDRDIDMASDQLDLAYGHARDAHEALGGTGFWRDMPAVGTQIRALEDATAAAAETLDGVRGVLAIAGDLMAVSAQAGALAGELDVRFGESRSFGDLTKEEKREILARLHRALPDMRIAQAKIDVALETWNRVPMNELAAPLRKALQPVADSLPVLKRSMDEAVPLLEAFIPIAGYPDPSHWIVLLQNTDEIRATGGFIGTVGTLNVDAGEIDEDTFRFVDVYNIDFPAADRGWSEPAPAPVIERMGVPGLFLRDANWSPDFPTSARKMLDFYVRETELGTGARPPDPSGIIAVNPPLFEELLRVTGPITVSDGVEDITFEADSFFDTLEYEVEVNFLKKGIPRSDRKQLVQRIGSELLTRLMSMPVSKWPDLLDVLTERLRRKQIQMYAADPALMARLDSFGWTGRTLPAQGDYLMIVDSNLAALKTDAVVDKRVRYEVDARDPSNVTATVTLTYRNNAPGLSDPNDPLNYKYTRYRSYTRVYAPEGAELISSSGAMADDRYRTGGAFRSGRVDAFKDLGKTVFGAFWSIEPGTEQTLSFTYHLPASVSGQIKEGAYLLDWQKQSGNDGAALDLDVSLGLNLKSASPPEDSEDWGDAAYRVRTDTMFDRRFEATF